MTSPDPTREALPPATPLGEVAGRLHRAVPYVEHAGYRPLLLDLYLPETPRPAPVVLFLHGGGWRLGSRTLFCPTWRDWRPDPFARMVAAGFAVASVDYRLSAEAIYPAQLDDVMAALRWLRNRADELGLATDRLVAWGESAGGHLAALLGLVATDTEPGSVAGVVDWYGPADLATMRSDAEPEAAASADSREAALLGVIPAENPERAREASPVAHVHASAPPFHLAHGTADRFVPATQSQLLAEALRAVGGQVELDLVPDVDHMWRNAGEPTEIFDRALAFATRVTRPT